MESVASIDISSEFDAADLAACKRVNDLLQQFYPGHPWMVGCNHKGGVVHIELPYQTRIMTRFPFGYLLYISSLGNYDTACRKVREAGGELLYRYGLPRSPATAESAAAALEHGLDRSDQV